MRRLLIPNACFTNSTQLNKKSGSGRLGTILTLAETTAQPFSLRLFK